MRRLLIAACGFLSLMAGASLAHDVSLGLGKDNEWSSQEHIARMEAHALTDHATVYYKLMSEANRANPFAWIRHNYLDANIPTVVTLIIDGGVKSTVGTSEGTDVSAGVPGLLEQVLSGAFDEALRELATEIIKDSRPITLRPFHEIDGGWYEWGMYASGNTPELAVEAIEHVVELFDQMGATNVSWEVNFNRRDGRGQVLGEAEFLLPRLNQVVDAYSVSTYNRCGTAERYAEEHSFADDFAPIYERITALSELPVNVAEVSTSGLCAPKVPWFEAMLSDIQTRFPRTEMVTFFFGVVPVGKASNNVPIYWGFDQSFIELQEFKRLIESYDDASAPAEPERVRPAAASPAHVQVVTVTPESYRLPEQNGTPSAETPAVRHFLGFDSAPWSFWANLSFPLHEEGNPALNTVTGNPFGEAGPVLRFTARQRFLWDMGSYEHGPGIIASGALSNNDDQWWNNQASAGLTYGLYGDAPRGAILWGGWSAELFAGHREYFAPTPERLDSGETIIELRFGINIGGDSFR